MTDTTGGPYWAENLDDADRQWIESFGIADNVAMCEGYLAVVVYTDKNGVRRWQPTIGLANCPTDSVVGIWTLAGHQIIAKAHELGQQSS